MTTPGGVVNYEISIQALEAVKALQQLNDSAASFDAKITATTAKVQQLSAAWGTSFKTTLGVMKQADQELSQTTGQVGVFGNQIVGQLTLADGSIKNVTKSLANVGWGQVAQQAEDSSRRTVRSIDAIRIALGAMVAMLVFNVIQAFSNFFYGAIKDATDLQGALYNLTNAERIMSQQGIEIAPKDLQDMANNLKALVPIISQIDATKAVSSLALFTKDLGYTKEQIAALSEAVGTLYVRNQAMGLSFEQVLSQVQTGLLTGRAQGIRDLGVSISEAAIKQEALRLGLVKSSSAFDALTGDVQTQIKAQAMLSIIVKNTAQEQGDLGKYMETDAGKMKTFTASIEDFKTATGQAFLPVLGTLAEIGLGILKVYHTVQVLIAYFDSTVVARIVAPWILLNEAIQGHIHSVADVKRVYDETFQSVNAWIKLHTGLTLQQASALDTATGSADQLGSALADMSKVDLTSLNNELIRVQESLSKLNREYAQNNLKYQDEYNTKITRMRQDAAIAQATSAAKEHATQLADEAKFQLQMEQLKEKYLYNLEDALRNRDARQVLRLQEQYAIDKKDAQDNFNLQNAQRIAQYKQQQAIDAANEKIKEQRALEDYKTEQALRKQSYDDALADLQQSWKDRLDEEAVKIAADLGITGKGVDAIRAVLEKYYGKNGVFDGLYSYSLDSLQSKGTSMLAELAQVINAYLQTTAAGINAFTSINGTLGNITKSPTVINPYGGVGNVPYGPPAPSSSTSTGYAIHSSVGTTSPAYIGGRAKGGVDIASKPTSVTFGEAGLEAAIFLPLSKLMSGMNNVPINASGGGGSLGGQIKLLLELSPDLVARVTENTLSQAAQVITRVYRGR